MRTTLLALAALCCAAAGPAGTAHAAPATTILPRPAPAQQPPVPDDDPEQTDEGGSGYLPGARFQRKLGGGPGFVCTATNALHDQQCTASCQGGETADCTDADGSGVPTCRCTKG